MTPPRKKKKRRRPSAAAPVPPRPFVVVASTVGFVVALVFLRNVIRWVFLFSLALYVVHDVALARLASWAIAKTPKAFDWTIESISVRPSWDALAAVLWLARTRLPRLPRVAFVEDGRYRKTEVVVYGWIWKNPPGFGKKCDHLLKVRRFALEIDLRDAVRSVDPLPLESLHLDGVRFSAERNVEDALNLWVALDLPDQDVNAVVKRVETLSHEQCVRRLDRRDEQETDHCAEDDDDDEDEEDEEDDEEDHEESQGAETKDLATPPVTLTSCCGCRPWPRRRQQQRNKKKEDHPGERDVSFPPKKNNRTKKNPSAPPEEPRRPRWGVPIKFDVGRVVATDVGVDVLDLLLVRSHSAALASTIFIDHCLLKDLRSVYLGELVWALIHVSVKKIVKSKPSRLVGQSAVATAFAFSDLAHYTVARALELAVNAPPHYARRFVDEYQHHHRDESSVGGTLRVQVLRGRRLVVHQDDTGLVSTKVLLQLRRRDLLLPGGGGGDDEEGAEERASVLVREVTTNVKMWTRKPAWNETFDLGPVDDLRSTQLVATVLHHQVAPWHSQEKIAVGEAVIPLVSLFGSKEVRRNRHTDSVIAWFRLTDPSDATLSAIHFGEHTTHTGGGKDHKTEQRTAATSSPQHVRTHERTINLLLGEIKLGAQLRNADVVTGLASQKVAASRSDSAGGLADSEVDDPGRPPSLRRRSFARENCETS